MALELSAKANLLSKKTDIRQQIILEIDGFPIIFGALKVTKIARYGDDIYFGDLGLVYGGVIEDENSRDYISLSGTSTRLSQQLDPDKEGATSVSRLNINLIDKNGELSKLFSPNGALADLLGVKAEVFINFEGGAHPDDSVRIMSGTIDTVDFPAGSATIGVAHPETLKRSEIFRNITSDLFATINDSQTTLDLVSTTGMLLPQDVLRTFVRIEDELIEYTGISGTTLTGLIRGSLGTTAVTHDAGTEASTNYQLEGDPLSLALKVMLSGGEAVFTTTETANFVQVTPTRNISNAFFVNSTTFKKDAGLVAGDLVTITGAVNGANNITNKPISSFISDPNGTIIVLSGVSFVAEIGASATASFTSKYNVLPDGCGSAGMNPSFVDVEQHEFFKDTFDASLPDYRFLLTDTINAKDFINKELYFVSGFFPVPRNGRNSVNYTLPPLAGTDTKTIDDTNVKNPSSIKIQRTINKNFYNSIVYKFDPTIDDDKYTAGNITLSASSTNRIKTVNKALTIESKGLRKSVGTNSFIDRQAKRFLDRYKYGAEFLSVDINYKTGFNIDIGDTVVFGNDKLKITDISKGNRQFEPRLLEVVNKDFNLSNGDIRLELIDSAFGLDRRFAVVSPSSFIGPGASTTSLPIKRSFTTVEGDFESNKWTQLIGLKIRVHNEDYTYDQTATFVGFSDSNTEVMLVNPALAGAPLENYVVELIAYPNNTDSSDQSLAKQMFGYLSPEIAVTSGVSATQFNVADASVFFVGSLVRVHTLDFAVDSYDPDQDDPVVTDITGPLITVNRSLGFTPTSANVVTLIGFPDEGLPYSYV